MQSCEHAKGHNTLTILINNITINVHVVDILKPRVYVHTRIRVYARKYLPRHWLKSINAICIIARVRRPTAQDSLGMINLNPLCRNYTIRSSSDWKCISIENSFWLSNVVNKAMMLQRIRNFREIFLDRSSCRFRSSVIAWKVGRNVE